MADQPLVIKDGNANAQSLLAKANGDGTFSFYHVEDSTQRTALLAALAGLPTTRGSLTSANSTSIVAASDASFKEDATQRAALLAAFAGLPTALGAQLSSASTSIVPASDASFKEDATQRTALLAALAGLPTARGTQLSSASTSIVPASDATFKTLSTMAASGVTPLTGSASATATVGPFTPILNRGIQLTLSGTWAGTAQLLRSTDGGTTKLPITVGGSVWASFTANCNEPVTEETESGATYYLSLTVSSGTITYRIAQ